MKVVRWKDVDILDLIMVSVFGVFVWNGAGGSLMIPLTFVLLRLIVSFSLIEKRKSSWLPILIFSIWTLLTLSAMSKSSGDILEQPSFEMAKVALLLSGDADMDMVHNFGQLWADENLIAELGAVCLFTLLFWGWMLFCPIVSYIRLWVKKDFIDTSVLGCSKWMFVFLLGFTAIWGFVLWVSPQDDTWGRVLLYPFVISCILIIVFFRNYRSWGDEVREYLLFTVLFFGAFLIGRETEHYLSYFGLLALSALFYKRMFSLKDIPIRKKGMVILVISGFLFMESQFFNGAFRLVLLGLGVAMIGYLCWGLYRKCNSMKFSVVVFLSLAFVLPVLCIGYNPYSVVHAGRVCKFEAYQNSYNGIVKIADGNGLGLRDRYVEILPCCFEQIEIAGNPNLPYLKVKEGDSWGIYDMETQEMVVDTEYESIYQYDNYYFRLKDHYGMITYYQYWTAPGLEDDSSLTRFVSVPCKECAEENIVSPNLVLLQAEVDNAPVLSLVSNYLVSKASALFDEKAQPMAYWDWANKSNRMIERLGKEYHLFKADTASCGHQAVERVYEMLHHSSAGNQPEMNCFSFVRAVLELYRAVDMNLAVKDVVNDNGELKEELKQEFSCWMDYYWSSYNLYADCILSEEQYSALPMDVNAFLENNAIFRHQILTEEFNLFKYGKEVEQVREDVSVERLEKYIQAMDYDTAHMAYTVPLQESVYSWIKQREYVASLLGPSCRVSYENLTRKIKLLIDRDLEWLAHEYEAYEDIWNMRKE